MCVVIEGNDVIRIVLHNIMEKISHNYKFLVPIYSSFVFLALS